MGPRASTVVVLTKLSRDISVSAPYGLFPTHKRYSLNLTLLWAYGRVPVNILNQCGLVTHVWWQRSLSTLAQAIACCLTAPGHYLNQIWLVISEVSWHSPEGNFTGNIQYHWYEYENHRFKITVASSRDQWVKYLSCTHWRQGCTHQCLQMPWHETTHYRKLAECWPQSWAGK